MNNKGKLADVIEGLKCCLAHSKFRCIKCPYYKGYEGFRSCTGDLKVDALETIERLIEEMEGKDEA